MENREHVMQYANEIVNQMTILTESAGRINGLATLMRSESRCRKKDTDFLAGELLDVADAINSAVAQMRYTIFPCEQPKEVKEQ